MKCRSGPTDMVRTQWPPERRQTPGWRHHPGWRTKGSRGNQAART